MKTGFKNPIEPKSNSKSMKSPWNFDQPHYDERSSCYVNAGSHYGVGYKQPVGHHGNAKSKADTLPTNCHDVETMYVSEIPHKNLRIDVDE